MNTLQLKRALEHNPSTKKIFGGEQGQISFLANQHVC